MLRSVALLRIRGCRANDGCGVSRWVLRLCLPARLGCACLLAPSVCRAYLSHPLFDTCLAPCWTRVPRLLLDSCLTPCVCGAQETFSDFSSKKQVRGLLDAISRFKYQLPKE
jgi:hypothetical protein